MNEEHLTHLDAYCERAGDPGFWAEPLNAITNLFFIFFAVLALRDLQKLTEHSFKKTWDIWLLVFAMFAIGLGSGLWHTYAVQWAVIADVIPIGIFINVYIFSVFIRVIGLKWWWTALVWAAYTAAGAFMQSSFPPDFLHGTVMYLPTYLMLIALISIMAIRNMACTANFFGITLVFTLSLTMRTIDLELCNIFPYGTHFLWHTLNAVVLYGFWKQLLIAQKST